MVVKRIVVLMLVCFFATAFAQDFLDSEDYAALSQPQKEQLELFLDHDEVSDFVKQFPGWHANIYRLNDEGEVWKVDFYEDETWLGYAHYDTQKSELFDTILPIDLSAGEKEKARAQIETFLSEDAEIRAILGNSDWQHDISYDMYDEIWRADIKGDKGVTLGAELYRDGDSYKLERLFDPATLDAENTEQRSRDEATNLARDAKQVQAVLSVHDNWRSYAESQNGTVWSVVFAAKGKTLITALVDIKAWEVLETQLP